MALEIHDVRRSQGVIRELITGGFLGTHDPGQVGIIDNKDRLILLATVKVNLPGCNWI